MTLKEDIIQYCSLAGSIGGLTKTALSLLGMCGLLLFKEGQVHANEEAGESRLLPKPWSKKGQA